ncbi:TPA: hypothetical protein ACX6QR_000294 [Photobacterium damselae]
MIRESVFSSYDKWSKPLVSEVAEVVNLLKEHGYDSKKLALVTGLQEKNINSWTANYKKEPLDVSTIPYPCWCFLSALAGIPNISTNEKIIEVDDIRRVLRLFKPTAFGPRNIFVCPTPEQFSKLIDSGLYPEMTAENICQLHNWNPAKFIDSINTGKLPFLNWCLIIMMFGINLQKMILKDLEAPFVYEFIE